MTLQNAIKGGQILDNFEVNTQVTPMKFSSIAKLSTFCRRDVTTWEDCYIHDTQVLLKDVLTNKLKYKWENDFGSRVK